VNESQVSLNAHVVVPVLEGLGRELEERRIAVENRIPEDITLETDANLLRIVYDNLLSNAVKYGREGGAIVLDVQRGKDDVTLSVQNDGQGIPPEKMPALFKKFSRLDSPQYAGKIGSGLGLYICRQIVEKLGGEIWAESNLGEWARFSFRLPHSQPGAP
jgi:signal transduction histidine kinase